MQTKVTYARHGYTIEVTSNQEVKHIATRVAATAKALDAELGSSDTSASSLVTLEHCGEDTAIMTWIAQQETAHAERYIKANCGLVPAVAGKALKRLLECGELELRPTAFTDKKGTERQMQGVYFKDSVNPMD